MESLFVGGIGNSRISVATSEKHRIFSHTMNHDSIFQRIFHKKKSQRKNLILIWFCFLETNSYHLRKLRKIDCFGWRFRIKKWGTQHKEEQFSKAGIRWAVNLKLGWPHTRCLVFSSSTVKNFNSEMNEIFLLGGRSGITFSRFIEMKFIYIFPFISSCKYWYEF